MPESPNQNEQSPSGRRYHPYHHGHPHYHHNHRGRQHYHSHSYQQHQQHPPSSPQHHVQYPNQQYQQQAPPPQRYHYSQHHTHYRKYDNHHPHQGSYTQYPRRGTSHGYRGATQYPPQQGGHPHHQYSRSSPSTLNSLSTSPQGDVPYYRRHRPPQGISIQPPQHMSHYASPRGNSPPQEYQFQYNPSHHRNISHSPKSATERNNTFHTSPRHHDSPSTPSKNIQNSGTLTPISSTSAMPPSASPVGYSASSQSNYISRTPSSGPTATSVPSGVSEPKQTLKEIDHSSKFFINTAPSAQKEIQELLIPSDPKKSIIQPAAAVNDLELARTLKYMADGETTELQNKIPSLCAEMKIFGDHLCFLMYNMKKNQFILDQYEHEKKVIDQSIAQSEKHIKELMGQE